MGGEYQRWASVYEAFEASASQDTWRRGIVVELGRRGCSDHRILDLGAGTGIGRRVLLEAFPRCDVVSLDRSKAMLEQGGVPVARRIVGDMAQFEVEPASFDFVVSGFDALNCLDEFQLARCFECVAAALRPGGTLVFDYSSPKLLRHDWAGLELERSAAGVRLHVVHRHEPALRRLRVDLELIEGEEILWAERHYHHAVDPTLLDELARGAGLAVSHVRDLDGERYRPSSGTHVFVVERPAGG